jgi:energy-coupling factor transporter ATP-binding protein EcfA2
MATHHRAEVAEAATRVVVLDGGRVALDAAGGTDGASAAFARIEGGAA